MWKRIQPSLLDQAIAQVIIHTAPVMTQSEQDVSIYDLWFRASSNIQIKQPTRCTLSCKIFYCLVV
jgi:hypothetical protein